MPKAGYSGRSLVEKLGIKAVMNAAIISAPANYSETLGALPYGLKIKRSIAHGDFDFIQFFATSLTELANSIDTLKRAMKQTGMLWISWPKKSSGIVTDLNENIIRNFVLEHGLVDIKVCAVDEVWSGLKFVVPVKDRK